MNAQPPLLDTRQRPLRDLRISITDRCNFRCTYCMPATGTYRFLPRPELLSFEEIAEVCALFAARGVRKLRLTGGEPLLRKDLPILVAMLSRIPGIEDLALTTNGFYLEQNAERLRAAGLHRVTVSLDSLDPQVFAQQSGKQVAVEHVLRAIETARACGFRVKVNAVIQRGVNDGEIVDLARYFRSRDVTLRFIEFMDVGNLNGWDPASVVGAREILEKVSAAFPCEPTSPAYSGEVARRYRYLDGQGEFGLITSITQPFCGGCHRARLSADGHLFTCLFSNRGHDLKGLLRQQGSAAVAEALDRIWRTRDDRYSELRGQEAVAEKVEMFRIGG